jgi:hypothetical protein
MEQEDRVMGQLNRREFVTKATQAGAAAAVSAGIASAAAFADNKGDRTDTIPDCVLGKTGLKLPLLGYGGAALPKAWLNPLSYQQRIELVRYAYDRGVRYLDTAGNYLESQAILGEALKDRRRGARTPASASRHTLPTVTESAPGPGTLRGHPERA